MMINELLLLLLLLLLLMMMMMMMNESCLFAECADDDDERATEVVCLVLSVLHLVMMVCRIGAEGWPRILLCCFNCVLKMLLLFKIVKETLGVMF